LIDDKYNRVFAKSEGIEPSLFAALHPHRVDGWGITAIG
jgi:hypothetical protein